MKPHEMDARIYADGRKRRRWMNFLIAAMLISLSLAVFAAGMAVWAVLSK